MSRSLAGIVLAAGKGTRMKSASAKVLHEVAGRAMVRYPLVLLEALGCEQRVLVIGHQGDAVRQALSKEDIEFVEQRRQLGTGHALLAAHGALEGFRGDLVLLCGDVPLIRQGTLQALLETHRSHQAAVTVLSAMAPDPGGYGRILRRGQEVLGIVEHKDATQQQRAVREINTGIYVFEAPFVFEALGRVGTSNAQGEYYLTDVVEVARSLGRRVCALCCEDFSESLGVNDRVQLAEASALMRGRINEELMRAGVTFIDPKATYVDAGVTVGADTILHPNVHLQGTTRVGSNCVIEPGVLVRDCRVGDGVHVKSGSVLSGSSVGEGSDIGPMAHLRPGTELLGQNKIGNFVETKKARIGLGSKACHLSYLGDAELGSGVNVGCGTITCNYDGVNKHRTLIEDDVFIGSDTQLVAPVRIGRNSLIGAGSTITKDVPADALALSRPAQKIIEGWRLRKKSDK